MADLDTSGGVRLLGVGVSGLADWIQEDLFGEIGNVEDEQLPEPLALAPRSYAPGMDVTHEDFGQGWVWGSGRGVVTVRFETAKTGPGPVRSFAIDEPRLAPLPLEPD